MQIYTILYHFDWLFSHFERYGPDSVNQVFSHVVLCVTISKVQFSLTYCVNPTTDCSVPYMHNGLESVEDLSSDEECVVNVRRSEALELLSSNDGKGNITSFSTSYCKYSLYTLQ